MAAGNRRPRATSRPRRIPIGSHFLPENQCPPSAVKAFSLKCSPVRADDFVCSRVPPGACARLGLDPGQTLCGECSGVARVPLRPGPAHVVQLRPVGVEQAVREGAKQPRSAAMEESVDLCFIHVSGPSAFRPSVALPQVGVLFIGAKHLCFKARVSRRGSVVRSLGCSPRCTRPGNVGAVPAAAGRSRRSFRSDESSSDISNVAN
jgi:hypothetical protein